MIISVGEHEDQVAKAVRSGDVEGALALAFSLTYQLSIMQELNGKFLFAPNLDQLMLEAHARLIGQTKPPAHGRREVILYVATEIYLVGGHTRLLEDMASVLPEYQHILVLTDCGKRYRENGFTLGELARRCATAGLRVIILRGTGLVERVKELDELIRAIAPGTVYVMAHHWDVIANAAVSGSSAPVVIYGHHCNYNPALGAARRDWIHIDYAAGVQGVCSAVLQSPTILHDMTLRQTAAPVDLTANDGALRGITCASPHKFAGRDRHSYAELLCALFKAGVTRFWHVGGLPEAQMTEIRNALAESGIDAGALDVIPSIVSLYDFIHACRPDFFLAPFPLPSARATLEAMAAGLPVITTPQEQPLLDFYGDREPGLSVRSLDDMPAVVTRLRQDKVALGRESHRVFQEHHSESAFRRRLLETIHA
jgi:hypothetical protein